MRFIALCISVFVLGGCATAPYQAAPITGMPGAIGGIYYEVARGDTLWRISRAYGIELSEIVAANNLSLSEKITPGQRLFIPGTRGGAPQAIAAKTKYEKDYFVWPCEGKVVSYFGEESFGTANKGIDIRTGDGQDIVASRGGKVIFSSEKTKGLGKTIIIDHMDGFNTIYSRNSHNLARAGDTVKQNQVIAKSGATGRGTASYLHFEVRKRSKPQNPLYFLP